MSASSNLDREILKQLEAINSDDWQPYVPPPSAVTERALSLLVGAGLMEVRSQFTSLRSLDSSEGIKITMRHCGEQPDELFREAIGYVPKNWWSDCAAPLITHTHIRR